MSTHDPTPRRRGRPRTIPGVGAEPREEILQHAARLFSANGVGATKMSDIASAVGVSAPTLYHHFENLDAIVEELLRYVVEESAAFATSVEAEHPGRPGERLASLIRQHIERLTRAPYDLWFVASLSDAETRRFTAVRQHATRWQHAVLKLAAEGARLGEFREVEPRLALAMVTGMVYGALQLRHESGEVDADEVARFVASSLRR
jgi:TetR/AcrR family transcriptional regulator